MLPWLSLQPANLEPANRIKRSARMLFWLQSALYVVYFFLVGVFLLCLPWMPIWENNYILYLYPRWRPLVANDFFKGAVLGLGIVNILIGIQEIIRIGKNLRERR
jgi:hypothetical protein